MRIRKGRVFAVLAIIGIAVFVVFKIRQRRPPASLAVVTPPAEATLPPGPEAKSFVPENLRKTIDRGTKLLETFRLDQKKCGAPRHVRGNRRCLGDYLLAVSDERGKISIVEVYENRSSSPPGYQIRTENGARRRGVNVPFVVTAPPGRTVVALRTGVYEGQIVVGAVYVPYSTALDTPELRAAGLRYLETISATALGDLFQRKVKSAFHRGQLIAEMVEQQHMVSLVLTEQMKSDILFVNGTDAERIAMVNRTLTILGANLEGAYGFTKSRVGAAGIAQLMPRTYARLRRAYPSVGLPKNQDARLDHGHAMKAMVLHADAEWYPLAKDREYRGWLLRHHDARRLMLAAGYNASAGTVVKAIKACGETWRGPSCRALPSETRRYLVKYEEVWNLLYGTGSVLQSSPTLAARP